MNLNQLLAKKNMSRYRLSKESGIPKSTIADLCSGKTNITKCSVETLYKISIVLNTTMESLIEDEISTKNNDTKRADFGIFKSHICHLVKDKGDIDFITDMLEKDEVRKLYNKQWYPEAFYLLAMIDYLSRENDIPQCSQYHDIRQQKLKECLYPQGVYIMKMISDSQAYKDELKKNAIPEFLRFNIVESEIRNVH